MLIHLLTSISLVQVGASLPDSIQFARLYLAAHEPIRDFDFIYEGERWNELEGKPIRQRWFQGCYAHTRRAGDTHLELYIHDYSQSGDSLTHSTFSLIGHDLLERSEQPDVSSGSGMLQHTYGVPGVLNRPDTPEQLFYYGWFLDAIRDPADQGYEAIGVEEVEGRSCLVVRFDRSPGVKSRETGHFVFWIDTERNWQPIRVDWRDERGRPTLVVRRIALAQTKLPDGGFFWFPISGEVEYYYQPENGDPPRAVSFGKSYIVRDTLRLNQDFPKERFSLDYSRNPGSSQLARARQEFEQARATAPPPPEPPFPVGPEAARARVDEGLREAEQDGTLVEAVPPSARWLSSTSIVQLLTLSIGVATLIGAVVLVRRGR